MSFGLLFCFRSSEHPLFFYDKLSFSTGIKRLVYGDWLHWKQCLETAWLCNQSQNVHNYVSFMIRTAIFNINIIYMETCLATCIIELQVARQVQQNLKTKTGSLLYSKLLQNDLTYFLSSHLHCTSCIVLWQKKTAL